MTVLLFGISGSGFANSQKLNTTSGDKITSDSNPELKYLYARSLLKDLKLKDTQKWMESAAKDGHTIAQGEVGSMYITGNLLNLIPKFTESEVLKIDKTLVDFDKHKLVLGVNNINNWMDNVKNTNEGFNFDLDKGAHYLDLSYKKGNHLAKISCDGLIKLLINSSEG